MSSIEPKIFLNLGLRLWPPTSPPSTRSTETFQSERALIFLANLFSIVRVYAKNQSKPPAEMKEANLKTAAVVLLAGGKGQRMGLGYNKTLWRFREKPLFSYSLQTLERLLWVSKVVLVVAEQEQGEFQKLLANNPSRLDLVVVKGGEERYVSVQKALGWLYDQKIVSDYVFVHDGARPFASENLWQRIYQALADHSVVCPYLPLYGSLRQKKGDAWPCLPAGEYRITQTPQAFHHQHLAPVFLAPDYQKLAPREEIYALEFYGKKIHYVLGEHKNIKITVPSDLEDLSRFYP